MQQIKTNFLVVLGAISLFIGIVFMILPGPAVIFVPLGLALLSLKYNWAKVWLKRSQRFFSIAAKKTDQSIAWLRRRLRK